MKRFILIDHEPWTLRRKQLFYDLFQKAGISLEVWDLSQWLHPGLHNPDELQDEPYLSTIDNKRQFEQMVATLNPNEVVIVEEVFRNWHNRHVYNTLAKNNIKTIKIDLFANTIIKASIVSNLKRIRIQVLIPIIKNRIYNFLFKLYKRINKIQDPLKYFSSNSYSGRTNAINHPDYENFRFYKEESIINEDYIVFCDIYFPYHSDLIHFYKLKNLPDGVKYQHTLTNFFDFLERKYHMPVIIAAHPKADYKGDVFGNRSIIKYHTDNLIARANMVILHLCNTISYAVLNDKPIAFVGTKDYLSLDNIGRRFYTVATDTFGMKIFNIDSDKLETISFKKVDPDIRTNYIYNYLTTPKIENKENCSILAEELSIL